MSANSKAIKKDSRFDAYDNVKSKSRRLIALTTVCHGWVN